MGYITEIRKKIGNAPIIMVSAGVLILNDKNEVLLQHRIDNDFWGYPGGAMELGETFEECAKRETLEETGLECLDLKIFEIYSGDNGYYTYPNGDEVYNVGITYICRNFKGELRIQEEEASDQMFFSLLGLPSNLSPIQVNIFDKLCEHIQIQLENKGTHMETN